MSWKGTVRSLAAASRRIEREMAREQQRIAAMETVQTYEAYIETITTLHKECGAFRDWEAAVKKLPPIEPKLANIHESKAGAALDNYKPNFLDNWFSFLKDRKLKRLKEKIAKGKARDEKEYQEAEDEYKGHYAIWEEDTTLAKKIISGDAEGYVEAIKKYEPYSAIEAIGSELEFSIDTEGYFDIALKVNPEEVIPDVVYKLTKTGKLSTRDIPQSKFNKLYQDHVASSVFRVAREIFALLPVNTVYVRAVADLLNTVTGRVEEQPILSVAFVRETLNDLELAFIDPSDALKNFVHNMKFKKTSGFEPTETVQRLTEA